MVTWIIGLSGSGKTTLAEQVLLDIKKRGSSAVIVDGDVARELWGNDLGYDIDSRRENAQRVVGCVNFSISKDSMLFVQYYLFSLNPEWCRQNLSSYYEVFIDAPLSQVMKRDVKGIYTKYKNGETKDVAGLDLEFPIPESPDLIISNSGTKDMLLDYSSHIVEAILKNK